MVRKKRATKKVKEDVQDVGENEQDEEIKDNDESMEVEDIEVQPTDEELQEEVSDGGTQSNEASNEQETSVDDAKKDSGNEAAEDIQMDVVEDDTQEEKKTEAVEEYENDDREKEDEVEDQNDVVEEDEEIMPEVEEDEVESAAEEAEPEVGEDEVESAAEEAEPEVEEDEEESAAEEAEGKVKDNEEETEAVEEDTDVIGEEDNEEEEREEEEAEEEKKEEEGEKEEEEEKEVEEEKGKEEDKEDVGAAEKGGDEVEKVVPVPNENEAPVPKEKEVPMPKEKDSPVPKKKVVPVPKKKAVPVPKEDDFELELEDDDILILDEETAKEREEEEALEKKKEEDRLSRIKMLENVLKCQLCEKVCVRGITLACCGTQACRVCATKKVLKSKECWACQKPASSDVFVNDEDLRSAVSSFKKDGEVASSLVTKIKVRQTKNKRSNKEECKERVLLAGPSFYIWNQMKKRACIEYKIDFVERKKLMAWKGEGAEMYEEGNYDKMVLLFSPFEADQVFGTIREQTLESLTKWFTSSILNPYLAYSQHYKKPMKMQICLLPYYDVKKNSLIYKINTAVRALCFTLGWEILPNTNTMLTWSQGTNERQNNMSLPVLPNHTHRLRAPEYCPLGKLTNKAWPTVGAGIRLGLKKGDTYNAKKLIWFNRVSDGSRTTETFAPASVTNQMRTYKIGITERLKNTPKEGCFEVAGTSLEAFSSWKELVEAMKKTAHNGAKAPEPPLKEKKATESPLQAKKKNSAESVPKVPLKGDASRPSDSGQILENLNKVFVAVETICEGPYQYVTQIGMVSEHAPVQPFLYPEFIPMVPSKHLVEKGPQFLETMHLKSLKWSGKAGVGPLGAKFVKEDGAISDCRNLNQTRQRIQAFIDHCRKLCDEKKQVTLVFWTHIEQQALLSIVPSLVNVVNVFVHDTYCLTAGRRLQPLYDVYRNQAAKQNLYSMDAIALEIRALFQRQHGKWHQSSVKLVPYTHIYRRKLTLERLMIYDPNRLLGIKISNIIFGQGLVDVQDEAANGTADKPKFERSGRKRPEIMGADHEKSGRKRPKIMGEDREISGRTRPVLIKNGVDPSDIRAQINAKRRMTGLGDLPPLPPVLMTPQAPRNTVPPLMNYPGNQDIYPGDIERREPAPHYQESDRSGYDQSSSSANIDPSWLKNADNSRAFEDNPKPRKSSYDEWYVDGSHGERPDSRTSRFDERPGPIASRYDAITEPSASIFGLRPEPRASRFNDMAETVDAVFGKEFEPENSMFESRVPRVERDRIAPRTSRFDDRFEEPRASRIEPDTFDPRMSAFEDERRTSRFEPRGEEPARYAPRAAGFEEPEPSRYDARFEPRGPRFEDREDSRASRFNDRNERGLLREDSRNVDRSRDRSQPRDSYMGEPAPILAEDAGLEAEISAYENKIKKLKQLKELKEQAKSLAREVPSPKQQEFGGQAGSYGDKMPRQTQDHYSQSTPNPVPPPPLETVSYKPSENRKNPLMSSSRPNPMMGNPPKRPAPEPAAQPPSLAGYGPTASVPRPPKWDRDMSKAVPSRHNPLMESKIVAQPARYSAQPANYSAQPANYSAQPANYSAQPANYSATPASYSAPASSYSAPVSSYSAPVSSYSAPASSYSAPPVNYSGNHNKKSNRSAPGISDAMQEDSYAAGDSATGAPTHSQGYAPIDLKSMRRRRK